MLHQTFYPTNNSNDNEKKYQVLGSDNKVSFLEQTILCTDKPLAFLNKQTCLDFLTTSLKADI